MAGVGGFKPGGRGQDPPVLPHFDDILAFIKYTVHCVIRNIIKKINNHTWAQHGQYIWQTHMGSMWVPWRYFGPTVCTLSQCAYSRREYTSSGPRVAHER